MWRPAPPAAAGRSGIHRDRRWTGQWRRWRIPGPAGCGDQHAEGLLYHLGRLTGDELHEMRVLIGLGGELDGSASAPPWRRSSASPPARRGRPGPRPTRRAPLSGSSVRSSPAATSGITPQPGDCEAPHRRVIGRHRARSHRVRRHPWPTSLDAGVVQDVAAVDLNHHAGECFSRVGVLDRAGVPAGHAGAVYLLDHLVARRLLVVGYEYVALDLDLLLQQMLGHVLECRHHHYLVAEGLLRALAGLYVGCRPGGRLWDGVGADWSVPLRPFRACTNRSPPGSRPATSVAPGRCQGTDRRSRRSCRASVDRAHVDVHVRHLLHQVLLLLSVQR